MIISILLIYLILLCFYFYYVIKRKSDLTIYNNGQLIIQIIIIITFIFLYILGLRVLNLFRVNKVLDLHSVTFSLNFILFFIFLFFLRKLIFYFFKISWFKLHYVMMCETNFSRNINYKYKFFYYNMIYKPAFFSLKYLVYINYFLLLGLFLVIFFDLIFYNLVLNYSLIYIKYYSLFKIVYLSYKFMITKQNLILDYYSYNLIYPGNKETNIFINYSEVQHNFLKEESIKYLNGVILEKIKYVHKPIVNPMEMPYFKLINR